jgi:hypothetical protein
MWSYLSGSEPPKPKNLNVNKDISNYINKIKTNKNKEDKLSKYKAYMLKHYRNELCLGAIKRDNYTVFQWAVNNHFKCGEYELKEIVTLNRNNFLETAIKYYFPIKKNNNIDYYKTLLSNLKKIAENNLRNFKNDKIEIDKCNNCIEIINKYISEY